MEEGNSKDRFAVVVYKDLNIVGHVSRTIVTLYSVFLVLFAVWLAVIISTCAIYIKVN